MFNPHQHQQQFHQHLRQLQQLFQQQTPPPPPPPPPPPQPPPAHHISHHHQAARPIAVPNAAPPSARMVNLCSATQTIIAPNPMLQGALLMQQMQAGGMRGFAMGGQQFPQFFAPGSRASLLGPVPMGVAIKTPHMGYPRHFSPHARYFSNQDFQSRHADRKREIEQKPAVSSDSQSEASGSRVDGAAGVANPGCPSTSDQPEEPAAKKQRTEGSEDPVDTESVQSTEYKSPDPEECTLQEGGSVEGPVAAEADEQSQVAKQMESTEPSVHDAEKQNKDGVEDTTGFSAASDGPTVIARGSEELRDGAQETSNKFFCYICNITCHNQQNFQSHMNGLSHQQKMMEIQHMSNACLVTLLPRVQESLQGARKDGEKRPGLQRWCSTCQTHFTSNVMEHRKTREHKQCSRSSTSSCTVCKQDFTTPREFVEHMKKKEHKQRVQQLWRDSGKDGVEELNSEILLGEEDDDVSDDEREEEEDGKEGLSAQMEVTLEDLTENEEFDADVMYGSSFVVPVAGFLCRLCNHFYHFESSARHAHCKTLKHFHNLKKYKALKKREDSCSTSEPPADLIGPDKSIETEPPFTSPESLIQTSPLQNSQPPAGTLHPIISINRLSTSNLIEHQDHQPSSLNQQQDPEEALPQTPSSPPGQSGAIAGEEPSTGEPEEEDEDERSICVPEEKTGKGRGRGAGKRRGRGGRRR